jgi:hypothetical protein
MTSRVPPLAASLVILAALALLLVAADSPSPSAGDPAEPAEPNPAASAREVTEHLEAIRGLEFEEVPRVRTIAAKKWADRVARMAKRQAGGDPAAQAEAEAIGDFLRLSRLAPPDFEIEDATAGVGELVAGFYEPRDDRLYLVEQPLIGASGVERLTAHELEHALQDQVYPRSLKLGAVDGEQEIALSALIEGDASVVERRYARRYLGLSTAAADKSLLSPTNLAVGLPPALAASVRFPYTAGADFVGTLYRRGGWATVNEAFEEPPTTTEQILHPGKWFAREKGERAGTPSPAVLGSAWARGGTVESGELDALVILAAGVGADVAARAAKGWDGGAFATYRSGGAECEELCRDRRAAVAVYRWDTPADALEFAVAAERYLSTAVADEPGRGPTFAVEDGAAALAVAGEWSSMAFAPDRESAGRLAREAARE